MRLARRAFVASLVALPGMLGGARKGAEAQSSARRIVRVGPERNIRHIGAAARQARDGDVVEIDAGDYVADTAVWDRSGLTIRSVGGESRLIANGASAEGKAIWVIRGDRIAIEGFFFSGARVPARNGAGIRHENGRLWLRDCRFMDNEEGLLAGNAADAELRIERCEFGHNGAGDGQSHNLYVGSMARLSVSESYFHHARVGHLLKSRARESFILYNRLTDESGGTASYELEFPWGGRAYVIGNIIGQSATTQNPIMIRFGAESYHAKSNELFFINNTVVNDGPVDAVVLDVRPGADHLKVINNLFVDALAPLSTGVDFAGNFSVGREAFADLSRFDCRLRRGSDLMGRFVAPGRANGHDLKPSREYVHPLRSEPIQKGPYSAGAIQSVAE